VGTVIIIAWAPLAVLLIIGVAVYLFARFRLRALPNVPSVLVGPADAITIAREKNYNAVLRTFKVLIDGVVVGEIGVGEVKNFRTGAGRHTVAVKIDWCTSRPLSVQKKEHANLPLRCGATYEGLRALFTAFVKTRDYVYVRSDG
jgi:hypothetical protein